MEELSLKNDLMTWRQLALLALNHPDLAFAGKQLTEWIDAKSRSLVCSLMAFKSAVMYERTGYRLLQENSGKAARIQMALPFRVGQVTKEFVKKNGTSFPCVLICVKFGATSFAAVRGKA